MKQLVAVLRIKMLSGKDAIVFLDHPNIDKSQLAQAHWAAQLDSQGKGKIIKSSVLSISKLPNLRRSELHIAERSGFDLTGWRIPSDMRRKGNVLHNFWIGPMLFGPRGIGTAVGKVLPVVNSSPSSKIPTQPVIQIDTEGKSRHAWDFFASFEKKKEKETCCICFGSVARGCPQHDKN